MAAISKSQKAEKTESTDYIPNIATFMSYLRHKVKLASELFKLHILIFGKHITHNPFICLTEDLFVTAWELHSRFTTILLHPQTLVMFTPENIILCHFVDT